jgi:drug/metabolite transporter (DMT)-like permease
MIGLLLILGAVAFEELGMSLGKREAERKHADIFTLGFLNMLFGAVFMIGFGLFSADGFRFDPASLPTMFLRGVLEIVQTYVSLRAFVEADRSAYGFIRIITIPLLLAVDIALGYAIGPQQVLGVGIIVAALILLFINHGIARKGAGWVLASAVNAVITISLYKYDIAHFNSVAFEQTAFLLLMTVFLFVMSVRHERGNPLRRLKEKVFLIESLAMGAGMVLISYSYAFATASLVTTAKRSLEILSSIVSGRAVFGEKHVVVKLLAFVGIVTGLVLLRP